MKKTDIDVFVFRINRQLNKYVPWHPEPEAMAVNVFSLTWNNNYFYMFIPFSLVGQVLAKVNRDKIGTRLVKSILVPSANVDDQLQTTIFLAINKKSDSSTQAQIHPLYAKLQLMAVRVILLLLEF